jgi:putative restriction endonuclease
MIYLEMSRDETHGGGLWAFSNCIWAPTKKTSGGAWPFWSKILAVQAGDTILHLRGIPPSASFVGYSTAGTAGYETLDRPPEPGAWNYSNAFYRADLDDFTPFLASVNLTDVFSNRRQELDDYFDSNRKRGSAKQHIFYVRQSGRLQCLNGAYLSTIDDELFRALFGAISTTASPETGLSTSVLTSQQLAIVRSRIGQSNFARELKRLYGHRCCFPSCSVSDRRFLVASHIARWSDNESLRGHFGNGLCFCLMHDKAFEIGLFTLNEKFEIHISSAMSVENSAFIAELKAAEGKQIRLSDVTPLAEALAEHRRRVELLPDNNVH